MTQMCAEGGPLFAPTARVGVLSLWVRRYFPAPERGVRLMRNGGVSTGVPSGRVTRVSPAHAVETQDTFLATRG